MQATALPPPVNEIPLLFISPQNEPCIKLTDGRDIKLPDSPFGRWYARTHFKKMQASPEGAAWYAACDPAKTPTPNGLLQKPREYQTLGIARAMIGNCALWFDMGLGKTFTTLAIALWLCAQNKKIFVVVCPPTVFTTWIDEINLHIDKKFSPKIFIAHGPKRKKILTELKTAQHNAPIFILTSYETLANVREDLETLPISMICFDESSKLKNPKTQRTQVAQKLVEKAKDARIYLLSGTPSTTNPLGFYSQYELLGKGRSGFGSYIAFTNHFAITKVFITVRLPHGKIVGIEEENAEQWLYRNRLKGSHLTYADADYHFGERPGPKTLVILNRHKRNVAFKNQEHIHQITQSNAYTVKKQDVLTELPDKIYATRRIILSKEQEDAYENLLENSTATIKTLKFSYANKSSVHAKLHQIANGFINADDGLPIYFEKNPKLDELAQILEENPDEKLIVWSPWLPQLAQTEQYVAHDLGIECLKLDGSVAAGEQRHALIHAFQNPAGPRVLIANPAVGGMGLNLTCAHLEVFMANWFMPEMRAQAEDRTHRIGQKNCVTIVDLVAEETLEPALLRKTREQISLENQIISMTALMGQEE